MKGANAKSNLNRATPCIVDWYAYKFPIRFYMFLFLKQLSVLHTACTARHGPILDGLGTDDSQHQQLFAEIAKFLLMVSKKGCCVDIYGR